MHVFLSYSRQDAAFVGRLADDLATRGIEPWLDTDDLPIDDEDRWRRAVVQGIRESEAIVVVLSPDSVRSAAVEREVTIAAEMSRRIIPILYRASVLSDGVMFDLAGLQRTDFVDQPYDVALDELTHRLLAHPATRPEKSDPDAPELGTRTDDPPRPARYDEEEAVESEDVSTDLEPVTRPLDPKVGEPHVGDREATRRSTRRWSRLSTRAERASDGALRSRSGSLSS